MLDQWYPHKMHIWLKIRRQFFRSMPSIILGLCIVSLLSYELWRSHAAAQDEAEKTVFNLVHVMSEQVARTVQSIDLNLQDIAAEIAKNPGLPDNDSTFRGELHKRLATLPYVRALFVIGADGFISHDTDYPSTPHVSLADREYFRVHQSDASVQMQISGPLKSRSVGVWFISMSRRINAPNGDFRGIVVAAVEPLYFERFYRQMWMGDGTILLLLENGTLLARSPENDLAMGTSFAAVEPFRSLLKTNSHGVLWGPSPIDGVPRLTGYQRVDSAPIVMLMTLNENELMRAWHSHATVAVIGAAILLLLLLALEWLSRRNRHREELARLRSVQTQRLEAIGRFAGGIAHDLGNLMRIVRSGVTVIRPMIEDKPNALAALDEIDLSLVAGRNMVSQLLSYAKDTKIRLEAADINVLVSEVLPILGQAAGPISTVVTTLAEEEAISLVDEIQFKSSLVNLVLNARDSMPLGGIIAIDVRIAEEAEVNGSARWIDVNVSDEGTGMTDDVRHQAFDPFFTTKDSGSGSGVGLSQVLDFVRQCSGRVEVFSRKDSGTTIRLRLPLEEIPGTKE
ncbi:hybrid sensor histidine kinase/response regulator [Rhizobium rhizogenes]|uniref:hybrid sensor histidine kinase/response regulator n=1 Tax=Rhizobium rhizogenes TaxID=359 RepID=UPI0009B9242F|nr:hybrid sensor histidine kinase/response regulator [Rhizobium rhizogenes]